MTTVECALNIQIIEQIEVNLVFFFFWTQVCFLVVNLAMQFFSYKFQVYGIIIQHLYIQ